MLLSSWVGVMQSVKDCLIREKSRHYKDNARDWKFYCKQSTSKDNRTMEQTNAVPGDFEFPE